MSSSRQKRIEDDDDDDVEVISAMQPKQRTSKPPPASSSSSSASYKKPILALEPEEDDINDYGEDLFASGRSNPAHNVPRYASEKASAPLDNFSAPASTSKSKNRPPAYQEEDDPDFLLLTSAHRGNHPASQAASSSQRSRSSSSQSRNSKPKKSVPSTPSSGTLNFGSGRSPSSLFNASPSASSSSSSSQRLSASQILNNLQKSSKAVEKKMLAQKQAEIVCLSDEEEEEEQNRSEDLNNAFLHTAKDPFDFGSEQKPTRTFANRRKKEEQPRSGRMKSAPASRTRDDEEEEHESEDYLELVKRPLPSFSNYFGSQEGKDKQEEEEKKQKEIDLYADDFDDFDDMNIDFMTSSSREPPPKTQSQQKQKQKQKEVQVLKKPSQKERVAEESSSLESEGKDEEILWKKASFKDKPKQREEDDSFLDTLAAAVAAKNADQKKPTLPAPEKIRPPVKDIITIDEEDEEPEKQPEKQVQTKKPKLTSPPLPAPPVPAPPVPSLTKPIEKAPAPAPAPKPTKAAAASSSAPIIDVESPPVCPTPLPSSCSLFHSIFEVFEICKRQRCSMGSILRMSLVETGIIPNVPLYLPWHYHIEPEHDPSKGPLDLLHFEKQNAKEIAIGLRDARMWDYLMWLLLHCDNHDMSSLASECLQHLVFKKIFWSSDDDDDDDNDDDDDDEPWPIDITSFSNFLEEILVAAVEGKQGYSLTRENGSPWGFAIMNLEPVLKLISAIVRYAFHAIAIPTQQSVRAFQKFLCPSETDGKDLRKLLELVLSILAFPTHFFGMGVDVLQQLSVNIVICLEDKRVITFADDEDAPPMTPEEKEAANQERLHRTFKKVAKNVVERLDFLPDLSALIRSMLTITLPMVRLQAELCIVTLQKMFPSGSSAPTPAAPNAASSSSAPAPVVWRFPQKLSFANCDLRYVLSALRSIRPTRKNALAVQSFLQILVILAERLLQQGKCKEPSDAGELWKCLAEIDRGIRIGFDQLDAPLNALKTMASHMSWSMRMMEYTP